MPTEIWKVKTDSESSFTYAREAVRSETPEVEIEPLTGAGILEIVKGASEHAGYGGALCPTAADIDRYLAQAQK